MHDQESSGIDIDSYSYSYRMAIADGGWDDMYKIRIPLNHDTLANKVRARGNRDVGELRSGSVEHRHQHSIDDVNHSISRLVVG
jgi:hypothetical protein